MSLIKSYFKKYDEYSNQYGKNTVLLMQVGAFYEMYGILNKKKIKVISFDYLTIDLCKKFKANTIIRGLRAVSDFEYEFQLAGMNKKLNSKIETMFLMSDVENQIISSKFVKEIASLGGNIDRFVTRSTVKMLKSKNKRKKLSIYLS